jgi:sulfur carrier protein
LIFVNGREEADAASVGELLTRLGVGDDARGVAVALDGEVVPRSQWDAALLAPGMRVEVVGAIQGG